MKKDEDVPFQLFVSKKLDGSDLLQLLIDGNLDRETQNIYNIQLIAIDGGTPTKKGVLNLEISVQDENDNSPVFSHHIYNVTANDTHQINKPILRLSATDLDERENGRISYSLSTKTPSKIKECFQLNRQTGELFLTTEFQFGKSYKIFVKATDNGKPPMSSTVTVLINGISYLNNPPNIDFKFVLDSTGNTAVISEATKIHSFVAYVKVIDNDSGVNGQVKCHLQNRYLQLISISEKKYKVIVKSEIDRESEKRFNFTIKCQDNGLPPLKVQKQFSMLVTDINDIQPQFSQDIFKFLTYENEHKDFPVGQVNATDPDIGDGGQLTYSLSTGSNNSEYHYQPNVDKNSFCHLDHIPLTTAGTTSNTTEQSSTVPMTSAFISNCKPPLPAVPKYNVECFRILEMALQYGHSVIKILEIKVMIEDVNDNYPIFPNKEFHLKYDESVTKGRKETLPNAIDNDISIQNSKLTYRLKEKVDIPFQLFVSKNPDGTDLLQLILEGNLDRETKDIYNIQLIATDEGSPSKKGVLDIKIFVDDKNDNYPVFSQNIYNVTINDTHDVNKPVVRLSATDLDVGENGRISYVFNNAKTPKMIKECFHLDEATGELFLKTDFDFGKIYELFIEARDNGRPSMSSTVTAFINGISHINNPPNIDVRFVLKSTGNTAVISEAAQIHSFVAYVKVIDNDSGENGQVKCHLQNKYLQLISESVKKYKVIVKSEIDRESEKRFNFTIKCQDNGLPPLTVEKQFSMMVTDINDVQPQFSQDTFKFLTYENEHKDFPVGYVNATDPDAGDGGQLIYSLLTNGKDNLPFQISDMGFISTTESLDREEENRYEFKVLVKDKGTPSLENTANVVVEIIDLNDNAPYFSFPNVNPFSLNVHYHPHSDHDISVKDSGSPVLSSTTTLSLTLTVSNNTSKIFKTPSKTTTESSNGLQLNVMIVIVIAAVIVSVVIVISISICIVHRMKQTDSNYDSSVDMYHKVTPTLNIQSKYIFDPTCVPPGVQYTLERNLKKSQQPIVDKEDIHYRTMPSDRWDNRTLRQHEQMFVPREESMAPGYRELNSSDQFNEMATLSSLTDSGHGWSVSSAGHYEELPDLCRYQSDHTWNRRNQLPHTLKRSRGDNNYCYHYQPNVNNSSHLDQIPLNITGTTSNISEQPSSVPMTSAFTSNCKPPLPAVPKVTTLPESEYKLIMIGYKHDYYKILNMISVILLVLLMADSCWCVDHIYHMKENNDIHSYIGDIVTDTQLLHNIQSQDDSNKLTFNILQGGTDGSVQLFNVTPGGKLYTAAILDAESLCLYNVECFRLLEIAVLHDHSFIKILEIKVMIEDVNDNYPIFPKQEFHIQFDESHSKDSKGRIPKAIDNDVSTQNSKLTYQLKKGEDIPFKLFVSKKLDGTDLLQLILEGNLDRETKDIYNIQLIARDGGSPQKEGVLDIIISVQDENDNSPLFSQNIYNITINDTDQMNKPIIRLSATDLDMGENGKISYTLSAKTPNKIKKCFRLNRVTGDLFVTTKFQFRKSYKILVKATDNGKLPMSSTATVFINGVSHINNSPTIDVKFVLKSTGNTAIISEATQIHSFVAYVKVTDNDSGVNGQVKCHLQNKYLQLLSISEKKYKVIVKSEIDRESEKRFNFTIKCQDNGLPPLTVEKQFSMLVTDINDVQPQFSQDTFKFLTYENEHKDFPVGYVNATDPDIGDGGQLTYSLLFNGKDILPFQISDVGFISTTESLDREEKNMYEFKVLVKDKGTPSLENTANVVVEVMDLNDNAPYFSFPNVNPFSLNVHYHPHSDHDITVVRASDRDSQHNAFLTYEILRGNEKHLFQMFVPREESMSPGFRELNSADQFTEMSTLSSLTDSGHGWSIGSAGHYEELPDLCRYQSDHTWNRRNQLPYTINRSRGNNNNGHPYPNVDNNTFCNHDQTPLTVTGNTSDITGQSFSEPMTSAFISYSKPPLTAVPKVATLPKVPSLAQKMFPLKLLVLLLMAESCWCVDHIYRVKENNNIHSYIGDIVTDTHLLSNMQSQDKLTFKILQGSIDQGIHLFNVTPGGQIYTAAILDAEALCLYNVECFRILEIAVQYDHSFIKVLEIKVMLDDMNDNYPIFPNKKFYIEFDESNSIGSKDIIPNAIDKDVSIENSKISYHLKEEVDIPFELLVSKKSDGTRLLQLVLKGNLDRETKDVYNIQLIAKDGGIPRKEGVIDIKILVKDKNDNIPVFSQKIYNITINDTHKINKPVVRLYATDLDEGENGRISYAFNNAKTSNTVKDCFKLNEATGELFLKQNFQLGRIYNLFVEARDNGIPSMSSTVLILINGISYLNNPPSIDFKFVLESNGTSAVISEATQIHSFVAYVKVTDNDNGVNGQVKCHLQNRYLQLISISEKKYKVVVKSEMDRESEKRFSFTIKCQDNGLPPLKVEKEFSMLVTDINDVQPQFSQDVFKFLTYENEHKDFPVGYVNATDPDIGDGGQLIYSLLSNGKDILPFQISDVGFISTTKSLDREEKNMYEFKVLVKDKGTPSLENTVNVVVEVMDLNDNAPYFSFPNVNPFSLNVHYHPRSDHDITVVRASDRDSQHNMFVPREESMSPGYRELNSADQFSEMSTLSSLTDSGHGWSVGSAGHYEELPDLCRYQSDHTWNRRNQLPYTINRSRGNNNNGHPYPNVDNNTFCNHDQTPLTVTGNTSDITGQSFSEPMTSAFISYSKPPLTTVPIVATLPKVPSLAQYSQSCHPIV
eukprot:XP_014774837.1 PREDICTED: uncharacterized protein LOC106872378 [Octopus bimaculoides]